ncbi:MAG: hypothetical protein ACE5EQ_04890 [Phycisphaerae bacterium]
MFTRPVGLPDSNETRGLTRSRPLRYVILAIITAAAGCVNSKADKYHVTVDEKIVSVLPVDLGDRDKVSKKIGVHFFDAKPSSGRFPAGLCVVRVEAFKEDDKPDRLLRVITLPKHHAVYWNHLFDELLSIREVIFLGRPGLDPRGYTWREILSAAAVRDSSLCIIYARLEMTDADAEYVGMLWDTGTFEALASFRAPVVLSADLVDALEEDPQSDSAISEADFRAELDFRHLIRDAIWDLAKRDIPPTTTQPSPWRYSDVPLFPRDYDRFPFPLYRRHRSSDKGGS